MSQPRPTGLLPSTSGIFPMEMGWQQCDPPIDLSELEVQWYWNEQRWPGGRYALMAVDRSDPPRYTSFEVSPGMLSKPEVVAQLAKARLATLDRTNLLGPS